MIGKTYSKQGAPAAQETVNIRLISNQSEHSGLVGTKFILKYETFSKEYTWNGSEVAVQIPAYVTYSVEFGDAEGYNTPEPIIYEAVDDNARTIEAIYTCELLTVNVGADEGTPEGYEVSIYKGDKIDLPSGYTFLEYIESSGTQYIDTGFVPNQDTRVILDFSATKISSKNDMLGSRNTTTSNAYTFSIGSNGFWRFGYNTSSPETSVTADKNRHIADIDKNVLKLDDNVIHTLTKSSFNGYASIYIGAIHASGTASYKGYAKFYSCQIYDNGILIRDYVPAKNSSGVAGLYDMANGVFYKSAGSAEFIAGAEIANPFTWLDYIESSGTQYIDTGFKPNQNTRVVFSGHNLSSSSGWTFGAWNSSSSNQYAFSCLNTYSFRYGSTNASLTTVPVGALEVDFNKNSYSMNGTTGTMSSQSFACSYNMFLFAINAAGSVSSGKFTGRMYTCKIYDNGTLVRNYIPAYRYDGSYGLYDKVNTKFYASASGTNFIAGDEVNLAGETIAVQTTATGSYKIPYGTEYLISANDISGFETPAIITRNASEASFVANIEYKKIGVRDLSLFDVYGNPINRSTANCYVVREPGQYKFPLVFGNAFKNGKTNTAAYTNNGGSYSHDFLTGTSDTITTPWINQNSSIWKVTSAYISNADIETDGVIEVTYNKSKDADYVYFNVNSIPANGGNVIISARADTFVIWHWHIWLWPHDLSPVEITNSTGVKYNIMPVNLASKYDSDGVHIKNWFYQWGRMTPLLCPASYNSFSNHSPGTITTASKVNTIIGGIQEPTTFYYNEDSPCNWFGNKNYRNLWDAACVTWGTSDNDTVKTVYDPCPVGWKVPNGNTFTGLSVISESNGIVKFSRYSGDTVGVGFPMSGPRSNSDGLLYYVGSSGYVWLSSVRSQYGAYYLYFDDSSSVDPQNIGCCAYGFSVRPVQDDNIQLNVIMISFYIPGYNLQAESGMTWFEWIHSEYNIANLSAIGAGITNDEGNTYFYNVSTGNFIKSTENIIGGAQYYHKSPTA